MAGVRIGGSGVLTGNPRPAFALDTEDVPGGQEWQDVWLVDLGGGGVTQVTSSADQEFREGGLVSPNGLKIVYHFSDNVVGNRVHVCDPDGSNDVTLTTVDASGYLGLEWIGNTTVMWTRNQTSIRRIDIDGTNASTLSGLSINTVDKWALAPDGSAIAFGNFNAGTLSLRVAPPTGGSFTTIVADCGNLTGTGLPAWLPDSSKIIYGTNQGGTKRLKTINPDGTGDADLVNPWTSATNSFFYKFSVANDRIFYTNTAAGPTYTMRYVTFTGTDAAVSPSLVVAPAVDRGTPFWDSVNQRLYTVKDDAGTGAEGLVSVREDGSDLQVHYIADESSTPYFQNISLPNNSD